jgi:hypothetical protein
MKVSELKTGQKFIDPIGQPSGGVGGLCAQGPYDLFTLISDRVENGRVQARNGQKDEVVSFAADYRVVHAFWVEPLPADANTAKRKKTRRRP